jgi:hypothetical protein
LVGDRTVVGVLRDRTRAEDVLAGLAVMGPRGTIPEVLPADADERADLVLAKAKPAPPPRPPRSTGTKQFLSLLFGRRMRAVIAVFLVLYAIGTGVFAVAKRTSWGDAAYSALITALTGNPVQDVSGLAKAAVIMLAILSRPSPRRSWTAWSRRGCSARPVGCTTRLPTTSWWSAWATSVPGSPERSTTRA